jgi:ABC-type Zn uptake system ZnuABC Zn-binding protein ZnuA
MPSPLVLSLVVAVGCSKAPDPWKDAKEGQLKVVASFAPIYCFTANVAEPDALVQCLLTGEGPHDYQATPRDAYCVAKADAFVINGEGMDDDQAKKLIGFARASKTCKLFDLSKGLDHDRLIHNDHEEGEDHKNCKHCKHGEHDPHFWLGPSFAKDLVKRLAKDLGELDPARATQYESRARDYMKQLDELLAYGENKLKDKKNRKVITVHEALGYFAQDFKIELAGSIHLFPGEDPDGVTLAKLIKKCKEQDVRVILIEPQYSRRQADQIQNELKKKGHDVRIVEFDTFETVRADDGRPDKELYIKVMRKNIDTLAEALP